MMSTRQWRCLGGFMLVLCCSVPAAAKGKDAVAADTTGVAVDSGLISIREKLTKLKQEAAQLRRESEALRGQSHDTAPPPPPADSSSRQKDTHTGLETLAKQIQSFADTIEVLTVNGVNSFLRNFKAKTRNARQRGYGGCIGVEVGVFSIDMVQGKKAIPNLIGSMNGLDFAINKRFEPFLLVGGTGYGGIGNGLRIGGSGCGGAHRFHAARNDTTYVITFNVGYGGILIEKNVTQENFNFTTGGILGGGGTALFLSRYKNESAFIPIDQNNEKGFNADFFLLELHSGFTYSMLSWFHMGIMLGVPLFISSDGYKAESGLPITGGFISLNPGLKIRIVMGNLG